MNQSRREGKTSLRERRKTDLATDRSTAAQSAASPSREATAPSKVNAERSEQAMQLFGEAHSLIVTSRTFGNAGLPGSSAPAPENPNAAMMCPPP